MDHRWLNLTFLHWRYPADVVQALVPPGLAVDTFDGSAWVGLVPFEMEVSLPGRRSVPWVSRFPETNVRTYVRAADGSTGIWFLSLDAERLGAVVVARTTYRLPYFWSQMAVDRQPMRVGYRSRRRRPGPSGATWEVVVDIGDRCRPDDLDQLDHWLTARFQLYASHRLGLRTALAEHDPWPLYRADAVHCRDELVMASGLPAPTGPPLVHWSPGVDVRIGAPTVL